MISNATLPEIANIVAAFPPAVPSSAAPLWASMKNADRATIVIQVENGVSGVTGTAVALQQATALAGTNAKSLAFSSVYQNLDTQNTSNPGDALALTAVNSNTFTTANTASKGLLYVIEVKATDLDVANSFNHIQVTLGNAVNATTCATYIIRDIRYQQSGPPTALA